MAWIPYKEYKKRRGEATAKHGGGVTVRGGSKVLEEMRRNPGSKEVWDFCREHHASRCNFCSTICSQYSYVVKKMKEVNF